jgi:hypothetical protein
MKHKQTQFRQASLFEEFENENAGFLSKPQKKTVNETIATLQGLPRKKKKAAKKKAVKKTAKRKAVKKEIVQKKPSLILAGVKGIISRYAEHEAVKFILEGIQHMITAAQ